MRKWTVLFKHREPGNLQTFIKSFFSFNWFYEKWKKRRLKILGLLKQTWLYLASVKKKSEHLLCFSLKKVLSIYTRYPFYCLLLWLYYIFHEIFKFYYKISRTASNCQLTVTGCWTRLKVSCMGRFFKWQARYTVSNFRILYLSVQERYLLTWI